MATNNERYVDYLDSSTSLWKRPESPLRVWRVVDGRRKTASGEIPRFSIQEVPKELTEDVEDFLVENFIPDEPTCAVQGLNDDFLGVREFRTMWRNFLRQGVSIVALRVNSDSTLKPVIAGVNILSVVTAEDEANAKSKNEIHEPKSKGIKVLIELINRLTKEVDILKQYGVDKYLDAFGLSVDPSLKGQGLGEEILRAREDVGRYYRIPVCKTIFSATASQILATRVGYEVLVEKKYSDLLDDEGKVMFPGIKVEFIKLMGTKLY